MRLWPQSLIGRVLVVLLVALLVSNAIGFLLFSDERRTAVAQAGYGRLAERVAAIAEQVEQTPQDARRDFLRSFRGPGFRVNWSLFSVVDDDDDSGGWQGRLLRTALAVYVGPATAARTRIDFDDDWEGFGSDRLGGGRGMGRMMREMMKDDDDDDDDDDDRRRFMRHWADVDVIKVSLPLKDGSWLNVAAPSPRNRPFGGGPFIGGFFFLVLIIILLTVWAVHRSTRPLGMFTRAAEQLGLDVNAPPMSESGPREVRRAATAFNQMQRRIRRFINDRTQMLAAISHDLRTPITRLRLRAEFVEDEEQRNKMLTDLEQMEEMITATLAFARDDAASEARQPVDLAVLLQGLCDDAIDAGKDAAYRGPEKHVFNGRPVGLRRLFGNLIDNAVKYGKRAAVSLSVEAEALTVTVDDDGPGIAEHQQEKVFSPFTRIEGSRSRETGGVGLGLAVVRSIARAHGGEASLENRPEGGLRVRVTLPVSA